MPAPARTAAEGLADERDVGVAKRVTMPAALREDVEDRERGDHGEQAERPRPLEAHALALAATDRAARCLRAYAKRAIERTRSSSVCSTRTSTPAFANASARCCSRRRAAEAGPPLELVEEAQDLDAAAARRDDALDMRAIHRGAHAVPVSREKPGEDTGEVDEQVTLAAVRGAEVDRRREIEEELRRDLAVLEEIADVRRVEPRGDVPVDVPYVVAERVLAGVREVEAVTPGHRPVVALQQPVEAAQDGPLEPREAALRRGGRHVPAAVRSASGGARGPGGESYPRSRRRRAPQSSARGGGGSRPGRGPGCPGRRHSPARGGTRERAR